MRNTFKNNKNLAIVALVAIVNALGYGIVIPILYSYSVKYGLNDFQNGLLFSIFAIGQFIATPIIGRLSDKYGRKPLLIASISGTAVSFFMMAFAPNATFLFFARALDGITAGNLPVIAAVISDTTSSQNRTRGFSIIGASFSFGFIFGPAISGLTSGFSLHAPFIIAGLISTGAVLLTITLLKETNKHMGEVSQKKLFDFKKLIHALYDKNVGPTFLITFFYFFAFGLFIYAFQPYSIKILRLSVEQVSFLFTGIGVIGLLNQLFLVPRLSIYLGLKRYLKIATLTFSAIFFALYSIKTLKQFLSVGLFLPLANGSIQPLTQTILSQETDAKSQGSIQGLNSSYQSLGQILGPILGGALATISIPFPLIAPGIMGFICFLLSFHVLKPGVRKESAF